MKYIMLTLIILSAILYPLLILTSCTEEEMQGKEATEQTAISQDDDTDSDLAALEAQAEIARERLIQSVKEVSSRPGLLRNLEAEKVTINATEEAEANQTNQ